MRFEDLPIRRKLISIIMAISGVVLILTCASFIVYELVTFRREMQENLSTLAQIVGRNSTATLAFRDQEDAAEILSGLSAERSILTAALYDSDGNLFASYVRPGLDEKLPANPGRTGFRFGSDSLTLVHPVQTETTLGVLHIKSDIRALQSRLQLYLGIVLLIVAISLAVAFFLATALQRRISNPILELTSSARKVTEQKTYGVRARKYGEDELGQLTDAFNEMLGQIHARDLALREKEERLRLALDASQIAIWHRDMTTGRVSWDEQIQRLFGFRQGEFDGSMEMSNSRVHPEDGDYIDRAIDEAVQSKHEFAVEFRVVWPDSSIRFLTARGKAFYDENGKPLRLTGVALDITENKQREIALRESEEKYRRLSAELDQRVKARTSELEAANAELEAFTYSVSHDLRAPLRHMSAYSQLLLEDYAEPLDPDAKRFLSRIRMSARNMGQLVDDLLNLARIGRQELKSESIHLNQLVDKVLGILKPDTEGRQIQWRINQLPRAKCDPGLMQQVFVNILANAVKYTRPRETSIIEIGQLRQGDEIVIFVRDNGVGFNMEYVSKLFGVFQRLHRQEDFEGTGVGLATVERIIAKHHGRIWAEAEENKGATFYFTFPGIQRS